MLKDMGKILMLNVLLSFRSYAPLSLSQVD